MSISPAPRRGSALHLLWAIPIALVGTWFGAIWMALTWCGISGCTGGGFGRISNPSLGAVLIGTGFVAMVWFGLLAGAPWHANARVRVTTAVAVAAVMATLATAVSTSFFIR